MLKLDIFKFDIIVISNDSNLMTKLSDVLYNPCKPKSHEKFLFFYLTHGRDNMGEIRISIPSENLGFPYPVCKNNRSLMLTFSSIVINC